MFGHLLFASLYIGVFVQEPSSKDGFNSIATEIRECVAAAVVGAPEQYLLIAENLVDPITNSDFAETQEYYYKLCGDSGRSSANPITRRKPREAGIPRSSQVISRNESGAVQIYLSPPSHVGRGTMWDHSKEALVQVLKSGAADAKPVVYVHRLEQKGASGDLLAQPVPALDKCLTFLSFAAAHGEFYDGTHTGQEWVFEAKWVMPSAAGLWPAKFPLHPAFPGIGAEITAIVRKQSNPSGESVFDFQIFQKDARGRVLREHAFFGISKSLQFSKYSRIDYYPGSDSAFLRKGLNVVALPPELQMNASLNIPQGIEIIDYRLSDFEWRYPYAGRIPDLEELLAKRESVFSGKTGGDE